MSYSITQQPDEYSLSAMVNDYIIASTDDITFEILQGANSLLLETYTPDADGNIYVHELGKFFDVYLQGADLGTGIQPYILGEFTVKINTEVQTYTLKVLKCTVNSAVSASDLISGEVFLNLMKKTKVITRTSQEYITCKLLADISVFITYLLDGVLTDSSEVVLNSSHDGTFTTMDISFPVISALFTAVIPADIVSIRVKTHNQIQVMMIDRSNYLVPLNFRYKNSFDVPDTITTRGNVARKGVSTFDTGKIFGIEAKYNVERADTFEVNSGKIFSLNDYDRYREMFNSEDVEIYFVGKWCKIIIAEENATQSIRSGTLSPIAFTFRFADTIDNRFITGESFMGWILEYGKWKDDQVWIDAGQWIGEPIS